MGKSNFLESLILQTFLQQGTYEGNPLSMALWTTLPAEDGSGGIEVSNSGTGYTRQAITFSNMSAEGAGPNDGHYVANLDTVVFGPVTSSWGTVVGWTIMDSGNAIYSGTLTSFTPTTGQVVMFGAGDVIITER